MRNGRCNTYQSFLLQYNNKWYYIYEGNYNEAYNGLISNDYGKWYIRNGIVDFSYNGTYQDSKGVKYIIKNGKAVE